MVEGYRMIAEKGPPNYQKLIMLEAFYASVDEQYGSMDAFLTELGVDQDARSALAASLTTEQPKLAMGE